MPDAIPLSLGIESPPGVMMKVISRNSAVPAKGSATITTTEDNQSVLTITVYEGERPMIKDNNKLGSLDLSGILPAPRGTPKIDITFDVDDQGILTVLAQDKGSGREQKLTISGYD